jgi:hypothetical protein
MFRVKSKVMTMEHRLAFPIWNSDAVRHRETAASFEGDEHAV